MRSAAWLLCGISTVPGELELRGSRLSFTARGTGSAWDWQLSKLERLSGAAGFASRLKEGGSAQLFRASLQDITTHCPWYFFSGGIVVGVRQQTYRFSFGRPVNLSGGGDDLHTFYAMRKLGKQWIRALATP